MELKNLRTFLEVVDQGSYQKAAERLGYSQSTITVQIQQLEEELGVPIFERVGRRMLLTEVGERMLPQARELVEASKRLVECGRRGGAPSGTLRVDMAETLLCYQMQPVIRAFREQAPQVRLVIRDCNCLRIPGNVVTGACDLAVGYDMDWNRESLEVEPLGSYDIVLLASPDFAEPDFTTPDQRKAVSLVTDEPDSIFRRRLEDYLRRREIELDVTLELWSIETIKRCVMSNLGFTYLPRFVAEKELAEGRLVELEAPISGVPAPALCAWRKGRWVTPAMELFLELLRAALAERPGFTASASAPAPAAGRACRSR